LANVKVCPSVLAADFSRLGQELERVKTADLIHVDVMDGHYVPNISFGMPIAKAIKRTTNIPLDVHLMITEPEKFIPEFATLMPQYITVHYETCTHLHRTVWQIKELGIKAGISLNPHTPVDSLCHVIDDIDLLLIMSVNPGFGGQSFIPQMFEKIRLAQRLIGQRAIELQVDGGVSVDNVGAVVQAGATMIVAGSAIFQSENPEAYINKLRFCK